METPGGATQALLRIAALHPEAVHEAPLPPPQGTHQTLARKQPLHRYTC